jgi:hypothetical protein
MNIGWVRRRRPWPGLLVGVLLLLLCLWRGLASPQQALLSYLFAFLFFTGLSLGSLAIVMVHVLTGGAWGVLLRPPLLAAARTLPLQAVLVLPIVFGLHVLYPWARADLLAHDASMRAQHWYLNPTFFVIRTVVYFLLWLPLVALIGRWAGNTVPPSVLPGIAAGGLIVYALSTLLAATDWVMSLLPHWHSSTFGMMVATGWMLAAAAFAVLCTTSAEDSTAATDKLLPDLGNLLLMLVLAWFYLAFMQYLTIWIADLPAETEWYIPRTLSSWRWLAGFLVVFYFAVPFAVLLSRRAKRRRSWLASIAALLLIASLADALWLIVPSFRAQGFALRWTDLLAPAGMGALWISVFFGRWPTATQSRVALRSTQERREEALG